MRNIEVYVSTHKVGSRVSTNFEVEDEATDDQIETLARETMFDLIEWNWREVK